MSMSDVQTARYETEAEVTRERIASTVDDLQERLNPRTLLGDVAEALHDTTEAAIETGSQFVREHPAVLAGFGLAAGTLMLVRNRLASRSSFDPYARYGYEDASDYNGDLGSGSPLARGWRRVRGGAGTARAHLTDTVHAAGDFASDGWHSARSRAEDYADQVRAHSWETGSTVENNPLAMLLIGIAAGALLGAILPRTRMEDEYLGENSDRLIAAGRQAARTALDVGRSDLQERGLSSGGARSLINELGEEAKEGLSGVAGAAKARLAQAAEDAKDIARHATAAAADEFKSAATAQPSG